MEKKIKIYTKDGHIIYGTLNYKNYKKLIIFIHGLTGHQNEHQFYNAARFFNKYGFSTFRFDLYSGERKGRKLSQCSIKTHSRDLDLIINYFVGKFSNIYLVGHSLGGPTILGSNLNKIKSIVLWDPSSTLKLEKELTFVEKIGNYILRWGVEYLISKKMVQEWKNLRTQVLIKKIIKPTKIICAKNGILYKDWKKYIKDIKVKYEFIILSGAGHCFDEEGIENKLFLETLKWFRKKL